MRNVFLTCFAVVVLTAPAFAGTVSYSNQIIPADADIFLAGLSQSTISAAGFPWPGGGGFGELPLEFDFTAGSGLQVTFSSVTGSITPDNWSNANGPDGGVDLSDCSGHPCGTNINSYGDISGIEYLGRDFFMVGVFLDSTNPVTTAPASLVYTNPNTTTGFSPGLNQVFFIGDGQTGSNLQQIFNVPAGADQLYLGFEDAWGFYGGGWGGNPGFYADDHGSLNASFTLDSPAAPEPGSAGLVAIALGMLAAGFRKRLCQARA